MRSTGAAEPAPTTGNPGGALAAAASSATAGMLARGAGAGPAISVIPGVAEQVRATPIPKTPPATRAEPSWGKVVATTVSLWLSRRMPRARADRRRRGGLRRPSWHLSRRAARGLRLATLVLALAAVAVTVLRFTETSAATARSSSPGRIHPARAAAGQAQGARAHAAPVQGRRAQPARAQAARAQAAAWIAGQVSSDEIIGCGPAMCAALQAHGVAAGRLRPVGPATTGLTGLPDAGGLLSPPLVPSPVGVP